MVSLLSPSQKEIEQGYISAMQEGSCSCHACMNICPSYSVLTPREIAQRKRECQDAAAPAAGVTTLVDSAAASSEPSNPTEALMEVERTSPLASVAEESATDEEGEEGL